MRIILIPGLWLDGSAWDAVLPGLRAAGHDPVAITLPGQGGRDGDGEAPATLDEQLDAILAAIDAGGTGKTGETSEAGEASGDPVLVVGHSAASTLAWLAADRRPERVARVAMVGGMPQADGAAYAPFFEPADGVVAFPGWEAFEGPDSDDLTPEHREAFAAASHTVPETVVTGIVRYTDARRHAVPVVMVCPEYSPEDAKAWLDAGEIPELTPAQHVSYADIDSGHWPMFSAPDALAQLLASLAYR
ncbi:MAG: alpha/beta fold hydrolase [Propionibacteriaceae bacterium]|nr:alpha/beta fold hydrolase [Propionibacteriaceae bacterium]